MRDRGEGSVTWHRTDREGRDVWRLRWYVGRDAAGRKKEACILFHGSETEARKKLREILARRDRGEVVEPARETLGAFLDRWLRDYKEPKLSPTTLAGYRMVIDTHLRPVLGGLPLSRIDPKRLQAYYRAQLAAGLSPTTVAQHARILHAAFRQAMKEGKIGVNPVDLTEPPKAEDYRATVWTREQSLKFLEVAEGDRYYALWWLLLSTGLRLGEALGLRWEHVHLDSKPPYLEVRESWYERGGNRGRKAPKSKKSLRPVVLDSRTAEVLRRHRAAQEREKEVLGDRYRDEGRVFATLEGGAPWGSNLRRAFKELAKKASLPPIRIHDLRHCHDTHLKQAGVHPRDQQDRLGHATLAMAERYTHVLTPDQVKAAKKWEAYMFGRKPAKRQPEKRTQAKRRARKEAAGPSA